MTEKNANRKLIQLTSDIFGTVFSHINDSNPPSNRYCDFTASDGGITIAVEVKTYRSRRVPSIENALAQLNFALRQGDYFNGVLVTTSIIESQQRLSLESKFGIYIIDRNLLFSLTSGFPEWRDYLIEILLELTQSGAEDIYQGIDYSVAIDINDFLIKKPGENASNPKVPTTGKDLAVESDNIEPGKKSAADYEKFCDRAVKYLFNDDLALFTSQIYSDDKLHRVDGIARIASINDFWQDLSKDFRTRIVVFEYKNYKKPIGQKEIYTTEKYLYTKSLRSVAIMLSRKGLSNNAGVAMRGALREAGKLILCLNDSELKEMLIGKDLGEDPNTALSEKLDSILMTLSR